LVSVGTGTSALWVGGGDVTRVGGTALGGGTILGLGSALLGVSSFDELTALAQAGDRRSVDLLVGDLDPAGDIPLPREMNASSFAKLARKGSTAGVEPADLAKAVMGLVGENVAIICGMLAAAVQADRIVYAGSSLRNNPALTNILLGTTAARGGKALLLPEGEFAGALGALRLAAGARRA
jgi:type II pantothenate kinase